MNFDIIMIIVLLINSLAFMFSMTNPLLFQIRHINKLFIYIYLFLFQLLIAPKIGQYVTIFMVIGVLLMIASSHKHFIINTIFSLLGFLIYVFINYLLTSLINLFGVTTSELFLFGYFSIIFILVYSLLTYVATYYTGKLVRKKLSAITGLPRVVQALFFVEILFCASVFIFNIIASDNKKYPPQLILLNLTLFAVLIGFTLMILFLSIYFIQKSEQTCSLQKEKQVLTDYAKKTEQFYQYTKDTRQNYKNIFSAIHHYIEQEDISKLKIFFDRKILSGSGYSGDMERFIDKLNDIKILELKSILYLKLLDAEDKKLDISFDVLNEVTLVSMDILDLFKIVEELIDNAIEAALESEKKKLDILLTADDISFTIHISNSSLEKSYPLDEIYKQGVTSKARHKGLGLYNVTQVLNKYRNIIHTTDYNNYTFKQTVEICYKADIEQALAEGF